MTSESGVGSVFVVGGVGVAFTLGGAGCRLRFRRLEVLDLPFFPTLLCEGILWCTGCVVFVNDSDDGGAEVGFVDEDELVDDDGDAGIDEEADAGIACVDRFAAPRGAPDASAGPRRRRRRFVLTAMVVARAASGQACRTKSGPRRQSLLLLLSRSLYSFVGPK